MIENKWLTGQDELTAVRTLRRREDDGRDGDALHVLVSEAGRDLATGRLYDAGGRFYVDMLAMTPDADPELLVLAVQLLVYKAGELGAAEVLSAVTGPPLRLLLSVGFMAVPPGGDPSATAVFRPGCAGCASHSCGGCGGCGPEDDGKGE